MATLDLDSDNITVLEVSVATVRAYLDGEAELQDIHPELETSLDIAQGHVFGGNEAVSYVVIKVTP